MDIHKKIISYCTKTVTGEIGDEDIIPANRTSLMQLVPELSYPWTGAMEATMFTGWISDFLKPYASDLKVANPQMLRAIAVAKKKNDKVDARMIADLLRCDLLPECYMSSEEIRELRRVLSYRNLMVSEAVKMKNKMSGLLLEVGATYSLGILI